MSSPFDNDNWDGDEHQLAGLFLYDGTRVKPYPAKGTLLADGTIVLNVSPVAGLGGGRKITVDTAIAVTAGNTVNFVLNTDGDGAALPSDLEIQSIIIQPHDGAGNAVATRWKFNIYTDSARAVDDIFFPLDMVTGRAAGGSNSPYTANLNWGYLNEEGAGEIPCDLYIEGGENNATFTVKIIFA